MRHRAPTIREQLRKLLESRALLTATRVATDLDQYVVLTLAPRAAVRFRDRSGSAIWESRVYLVQPPSFGIGTQPHYAALDTDRDAALFRHETLLRRLECGSFAQETSREILRAIRPFVAHAAQLLRNGDPDAAVIVLEAALHTAGRLDLVRRFLHLYAEIFLMRALAMEKANVTGAAAAYREFIALHAEHPLHHSETLRAVAQAREAIERLTPTPAGTRSHAQGRGPSADSTTATGTQ
jgi:hypothetical protein